LTTSSVGAVAVKFSGLGLGNTGATVAGAGAAGTWVGAAGICVSAGACVGAAGTCVWAEACNRGRAKANNAAVLRKRADGRINLYSLVDRDVAGKLPDTSLYPDGALRSYLDFDGNGKSAPHSERLGGHFEDGSGLLALVLGTLDEAHHLLD